MPYKAIAKTIIEAIEARVKANIAVGNFGTINLTTSDSELKNRMGLERLKTITRKRLIASLCAADYIVSDDGEEITVEVDVASRYTDFESLEDLLESLE